jgi:hypothetical protein
VNRYTAREEGAVAVVTAIALLVLMGIAALAVDAGRAYLERSQMQNTADHAALAAAWADCDDRDPEEAGEASAARNLEGRPLSYMVSIDPAGEGWSATVSGVVPAPFGRAIGLKDMEVRATATAACEQGTSASPVYAIFATGECPSDKASYQFGGNFNQWHGNVHSNGGIYFSGNDNDFRTKPAYGLENRWSYVTDLFVGGSNNHWQPEFPNPEKVLKKNEEDWNPQGWKIEDFVPGGSVAVAESAKGRYFDYQGEKITFDEAKKRGWTTSDSPPTLKSGIHFTTDDIDADRGNMRSEPGGVTFVASGQESGKGRIKFGNDQVLRPYYQDLLAFTNMTDTKPCELEAVLVNGNYLDGQGIIFAPRATVRWAGENNRLNPGGLVAHRVITSGNLNLIVGYAGQAIVTDEHVDLLR